MNFLEFFWKQLGVFVLRSLNHGYTIGELSITKNKALLLASQKTINQRPLTLLDTGYKLASGTIAHRIKTVLDVIINKDQTCFIKG